MGYFRKAKHLHKGDFSRLFLKDDVLQLTFEIIRQWCAKNCDCVHEAYKLQVPPGGCDSS